MKKTFRSAERFLVRRVLLCGLLLMLNSCFLAKRFMTAPAPVPSGFLGDYSDLQPSENQSGVSLYMNPQRKLNVYRVVLVDPVETLLAPTVPPNSVDRQALAKLASMQQKEIRQVMESTPYPVVDTPAFGVLRIRAAITHLSPESTPKDGALATELDLQQATFEAELVDALSGERMIAFMGPFSGEQYRQSLGQENFNETHDALRTWAIDLRDVLHQARGFMPNTAFRTIRRTVQ